MERWNGRVVLVTGASAGIGAEICRELVRHGMIVVGCARNAQKISEIAEEEPVKSSPGKLYAVKYVSFRKLFSPQCTYEVFYSDAFNVNKTLLNFIFFFHSTTFNSYLFLK